MGHVAVAILITMSHVGSPTATALRLNAIRDACESHPDSRTDDDISTILEFVRDVKFFSQLTTIQQQMLCQMMTLETFQADDTIFKFGEFGDKFYIILSGSAKVQLPNPKSRSFNVEDCDTEDGHAAPLETVAFLQRGDGFGELALQSSQPRSATIKTDETTEVLVTTRTDYTEYAGEKHRQFMDQRVEFLRNCPYIEEALKMSLLSNQDIAAMANCLSETSLRPNTVVCRQGDAMDNVIFVRSGRLAMLRIIDVGTYSSNEDSDKSGDTCGLVEKMPPAKNRPCMGSRLSPPMSAGSACEVGERPSSHRGCRWAERRHQSAEGYNRHRACTWPQLHRRLPSSPRQGRKDHKGCMEVAKSAGDDDASLGGSSASKTLQGRATSKLKRLSSTVKEGSTNKIVSFNGLLKEENDDPGSDAFNCNHNRETALSCNHSRERGRSVSFSEHGTGGHALTRPGTQLIVSDIANATKASDEPVQDVLPRHRRRLLRIGILGPNQYFGVQQVQNNDANPVSLVSDPVANIYLMSRGDIVRRLPKKFSNALLTEHLHTVPTDAQLRDMYNQNKRWSAFCESLHGEVLNNVKLRSQICGVPHRSSSIMTRVQPNANLEFLGLDPKSLLGETLRTPPRNKPVTLLKQDTELFSQGSMRLMCRFRDLKSDPDLKEALMRDGRLRSERLHDGLPGGFLGDDENDQLSFWFENHWKGLGEDHPRLGFDFGVMDFEDSSQCGSPTASPDTHFSAAKTRTKISKDSCKHNTENIRTRMRACRFDEAASLDLPPISTTNHVKSLSGFTRLSPHPSTRPVTRSSVRNVVFSSSSREHSRRPSVVDTAV